MEMILLRVSSFVCVVFTIFSFFDCCSIFRIFLSAAQKVFHNEILMIGRENPISIFMYVYYLHSRFEYAYSLQF